jgi:hypothetical protein
LTSRAWLPAIVVLLAAGLSAQEPPSFRISVNLVQIDVTVKDSHGQPVRDLTAADFEIHLDGKPQPITNFSYVETNAAATGDATISAAPPRTAARLKPEQGKCCKRR